MIRTEIENRIGFITLNRPEKRNAFAPQLVEELRGAFTEFETRDEVKVIVLRAEGKAFCAGADLAYLQKLQGFTYEENLDDSRNLMSLFDQIYNFPKVVIAQVQGHALAGGCGLMTVCDFAFAVPDALFGYTEVKIGFIPALVSVYLHELLGGAKTQRLLLSGDLILAPLAKELGLIHQVVEPELLSKTVEDFAQQLIHNNSTHSMAETKKLLRQLHADSRGKNLQLAAEMNARGRSHPDCVHGIESFLSKSKPNW
ncbi:enoyl-CoA hydratase/isomerase family protein [Algoriphagus namhaensis]